MRAKETFIEAGGESLELIPCMNEHPLWLKTLENMVADFLSSNHSTTKQEHD